MNVSYDIEYETVTLTCPKCSSTYEMRLRSFLDLLKSSDVSMSCDDCKSDFIVTTVLLDPRSPTLREPEPAFAGAFCECAISHFFQYGDQHICIECGKPPRS